MSSTEPSSFRAVSVQSCLFCSALYSLFKAVWGITALLQSASLRDLFKKRCRQKSSPSQWLMFLYSTNKSVFFIPADAARCSSGAKRRRGNEPSKLIWETWPPHQASSWIQINLKGTNKQLKVRFLYSFKKSTISFSNNFTSYFNNPWLWNKTLQMMRCICLINCRCRRQNTINLLHCSLCWMQITVIADTLLMKKDTFIAIPPLPAAILFVTWCP